METVELTESNIEKYLNDCVEVQKFLVSDASGINPAQFIETASAPHSYFIAVVEDGRVAGLGVINKIVHPSRTNVYVDNIVVSPDFRGQGLFSVIMDTLEEKAKQWGAESIKLTCSREAVQPMYEKRGYIEKTTTKYYVKKF